MAPPTPAVRGTPDGLKLWDGFPTTVAMENLLTIPFWEKTVTPPGIDGGEAIEQSTMHNVAWRTFRARSLKTLTPMTLTAANDPAVFTNIEAQCNIEQTFTVKLADGSTIAFYGYLQKFEPQSHEEGTQPEATITIVPTNRDPSDGSEAGPAIDETPGT
jgi:hypothetical protein